MVDNVPLGGCGRGPGVGVVGRTEDNTVLREPCVPIRAGGKAAPRLAESAPASGGIQTHTCEARCPLVHLNGERPGRSHGVPVGVSRVQLLRFHWREPTLLSDAASQEPSATVRPHLLSGV